jgi:hypothetical protein
MILFGRFKYTWNDDIKKDVRRVECEDVKQSKLFQDKVKCQTFVNMVTKLVLSSTKKEFLDQMSIHQFFKEESIPQIW